MRERRREEQREEGFGDAVMRRRKKCLRNSELIAKTKKRNLWGICLSETPTEIRWLHFRRKTER